MIRAHFGLDQNPFSHDGLRLLGHQQEIFDTVRVHSQQGGLCVLVGEPGTGKSVIKDALRRHDPRRLLVPVVNRTLHTYHSVLRILCEAFQIDSNGRDFTCEKRLIDEAHRINHQGKMLTPIIDDAHLMKIGALRRLRLLFEDFPKNHNLVLLAQPILLHNLALSINEDIKSRVTYSVHLKKLAPDDITTWVHSELDRVALAHSSFSPEALGLIVRSGEGVLRRTRNLCLGALLECVRDRTRIADLKQVNRVLMQPHWRQERDLN